MRRSLIVAALSFGAIACGCESQHITNFKNKTKEKYTSSMDEFVKPRKQALLTATTRVATTPTTTPASLAARVEDVFVLEKRLALVKARWEISLTLSDEEIRDQEFMQGLCTVFSAASAITSMALTTASGANKVLSVAFAGLAGSSASTAGPGLFSAASSGLNPSAQAGQLAASIKTWNTDYANVNIYGLEAMAIDPTVSPTAWGQAADKASSAIETLESDVNTLSIPSVSAPDTSAPATPAPATPGN